MTWELGVIDFVLLHTVFAVILGGLLFSLDGLKKWIRIGAEMRSWFWYAGFLAIAVAPFVVQGYGSMVEGPRAVIESCSPLTNWKIPQSSVSTIGVVVKVFVALWMVGCLWRSFYLLKECFESRSLLRKVLRTDQFDVFKREVKAPVYLSEDIACPMVIGVFVPKIILPAELLSRLSKEQIRYVLLHEQAHIDRCDLWCGLLQELVSAVFWMSPMIRLMNRRVQLSRELACDSRVTTWVDDHRLYAKSLLECAIGVWESRRNTFSMGMFDGKNDIKIRMREVVVQNGHRSLRRSIVVGVLGAMILGGSAVLASSAVPNVELETVAVERAENHFVDEGD